MSLFAACGLACREPVAPPPDSVARIADAAFDAAATAQPDSPDFGDLEAASLDVPAADAVAAVPATDAGRGAATDADTPDAAATDGNVAAAADSGPDVVDAATQAPQLCFDALPAETAAVVDVPPPDGAGCDLKSPMVAWQVAGPPTLAVEVGVGDAAGQFHPYLDGQWVPLAHGAQCGFHVWAAFRVTLPGSATAKQEVDAKGRAYSACGQVASSFENDASVHADPGAAGTVTNASALKPGLTVAFIDKSIQPLCGQWVRVVVEVRDPKSTAWGRGERLVRLYDGPPFPGCPPSP